MRMQQYINSYFPIEQYIKSEMKYRIKNNYSGTYVGFILSASFAMEHNDSQFKSDILVSIQNKNKYMYSISICITDFRVDENNNNIISGVSKIEEDITYDEVMLFVRHIYTKIDLADDIDFVTSKLS